MRSDRSKLANAALLVPGMMALSFSLNSGASRERRAADPPTLNGAVNLTIGGAGDDREEYEFQYVSGLALDASGRILVADAGSHNIRVYSAAGNYLFTMGQKGAGPGDLNRPSDINIAADGKLWIRDNGNHRFNVVDPSPPAGKPIRVVPYLTNDQLGDRVHWDAAGHVVEVTTVKSAAMGQMRRGLRNFLDARGAVIMTDTGPPASRDSVESWVFRTAESASTYIKPFGARRLEAYGNGGNAAYATNTRYAVQLVDAKGKQIASLKRELPSVALGTSDEAIVAEALGNIAKYRKVPVSSLDFDKPRFKPIVASLQFDMDGRLWVERSVISGQPHEADLYSRDGKWVRIMRWPANVSLTLGAISGNTGLGVAQDTDGVQRVVRVVWK